MNTFLKYAVIFFVGFLSIAESVYSKEDGDNSRGSYFLLQTNYSLKSQPSAFRDEWKNGWGGAFGAETYICEKWSGRFLADMTFFGFDKISAEEDLSNYGSVRFDISPLLFLSCELQASYSFFESNFTPFVMVGIGYMGVLGGDGYIYINNSQYYAPLIDNNAFILNSGFGVKYQNTDRYGFYLQTKVKYGLSFGDNYVTYPVSFGVTVPMNSGLGELLNVLF
ncbi:hypothetical protein CHISP_3718 [Chitinispirillum alkaliphilum]|nr:hypothetical protein CHISP_3718 [Chitinispirillum alkaliphilum]